MLTPQDVQLLDEVGRRRSLFRQSYADQGAAIGLCPTTLSRFEGNSEGRPRRLRPRTRDLLTAYLETTDEASFALDARDDVLAYVAENEVDPEAVAPALGIGLPKWQGIVEGRAPSLTVAHKIRAFLERKAREASDALPGAGDPRPPAQAGLFDRPAEVVDEGPACDTWEPPAHLAANGGPVDLVEYRVTVFDSTGDEVRTVAVEAPTFLDHGTQAALVDAVEAGIEVALDEVAEGRTTDDLRRGRVVLAEVAKIRREVYRPIADDDEAGIDD